MEITLRDLKELLSITGTKKEMRESPFIGKTCIVKAHSEGVFIGDVTSVEHDGNSRRTVTVKNSRRIWSWKGALCCEDIAQRGITDGKLSVFVEGLKEVCGVLSLIEVSKESKIKIMGVAPSVNN